MGKPSNFDYFLNKHFYGDHLTGKCQNPHRVGLSGFAIFCSIPFVGWLILLMIWLKYKNTRED